MRKLKYGVGDVVIARLYDARHIQGQVCMVTDTVGGPKVRILSGDCVFYLNAAQIVRVVSRSKE